MRQIVLGCAVLAFAVLAYLPGLSGPLFFDDKAALSGNELVKLSGSEADQWRVAALSSNSGPTGRPVSMLTFAANYALAGEFDTFALKSVNLALHLVTGLLVYGFAYYVFSALHGEPRSRNYNRCLAGIAATAWLLHPLHVSTVLYAVQRMAILSTLFTVAGLLVFIRSRLRWARFGASQGEVMAVGLWVLLLGLLGTCSKENGALMFWLVAVVEVCLFAGQWNGQASRWLNRLGIAALVAPFLLMIFVAVVQPGGILSGYGGREFSLEQRVTTQFRLLWQYLSWLSFPDLSAMGFQHDDIKVSAGLFSPLISFFSLLAWVLLLSVAWVFRRFVPVLLFSLSFYLVGHSMESGILPLEMVYEHRNYLPSIGFFILVAALLGALQARLPTFAPVAGLSLMVGSLFVLLLLRSVSWSDELVMSAENVRNHPHSSRSHYFYGNTLMDRYRDRERLGLSSAEAQSYLVGARHSFERMYQENPRDIAAIVMLHQLDETFFTDLQNMVDWMSRLETVVPDKNLQASDRNALSSLATCYAEGRCQKGYDSYLGVLDELATRHPRSQFYQLLRYRMLSGRDREQALAALHKAIELNPKSTEPYLHIVLECSEDKDVSCMYEAARKIALYDDNRTQLGVLERLLGTGGG